MATMVTALIGGGPGTVAVGLVPLFAIGMVYYRYLMADPESRAIDVPNVSIPGFPATVLSISG